MNIGSFRVVAFDEFNFAVYHNREMVRGDNAGEMKEYLLGYYGTLDGALNKLCSEALKGSLEHSTASELLEAVSSLHDSLNERYGSITAKRIIRKGEEV